MRKPLDHDYEYKLDISGDTEVQGCLKEQDLDQTARDIMRSYGKTFILQGNEVTLPKLTDDQVTTEETVTAFNQFISQKSDGQINTETKSWNILIRGLNQNCFGGIGPSIAKKAFLQPIENGTKVQTITPKEDIPGYRKKQIENLIEAGFNPIEMNTSYNIHQINESQYFVTAYMKISEAAIEQEKNIPCAEIDTEFYISGDNIECTNANIHVHSRLGKDLFNPTRMEQLLSPESSAEYQKPPSPAD